MLADSTLQFASWLTGSAEVLADGLPDHDRPGRDTLYYK
jgi:hypothetical protein